MEIQTMGSEGFCDSGTANTVKKAKTSDEKAILLDKVRRVSAKTAVKLRYAAIAVSWVSVCLTLSLGTGAIVFAVLYDSQSLFSFGLDSLLDCISSFIILWRFHGSDTLYSEIKELRACLMIGVLFVLSGILLAVRCIVALEGFEYPEKPTIALILAAVTVFLCLLIGTVKIMVGYKIESRALVTDSIITFVGAVMSTFTLVFSAVYKYNKRLWYLDDSFGLLCSVFLAAYGTRIIIVSKRGIDGSAEK